MPNLPQGTVTLLFTDIEGSTRLLQELGRDQYVRALSDQRRIVRDAFTRQGGVEVEMQGDSFHFAFAGAHEAVAAAAEAQRALAEHEWESEPIRIRIGIHTGEPIPHEGLYAGLDVHRAARIMSVGHGGQVLLSHATRELLDSTIELRDLGEHRLKDIEGPVWIFQLGTKTFAPLKTISNTNLPRPASSFVGRSRELEGVLALIRQGSKRLVTLTGPGGSGKTRLAIEAAAELVGAYPHGVFWVGLAPLRDPALVTETIAQTLGAKDGLAAHIAQRELLLLVDNFEQVIEAAPELSTLLERCPRLALLVTSRELLRVRGEVEYEVPPLVEAEAVELFCERARTTPSAEVEELCARLDNLPLAVELAAGRAKALSPAQIVERLAQRLDLFKGGRDVDARQQTLRATIEWSHELLSDDEQTLFRRLAVFAGGCTLEAAEEVCEAALDTIQSLVEKNLVRFSNDRYWMLETVREYAFERLEAAGEVWDMCRRHAEHVAAARPSPRDVRKADPEVLALVDSEHDNFRAAFDWALEHDRVEIAQDIHESIWFYWLIRGFLGEGAERGRRLLAKTTGDGVRDALTFTLAAEIPRWLGDFKTALALKERARPLLERHKQSRALAALLTDMGSMRVELGELDRARPLIEDGIRLREQIGEAHGIAHAEDTLADLEVRLGNYERALEILEAGVPVWRDERSWNDVATSLVGISQLRRKIGQLDESGEALREAIELGERLGDLSILAEAVEQSACLLWARNLPTQAVCIWGAAEAVRSQSGMRPRDAEEHGRLLEDARTRLDTAEFEAAWEEGAESSLDEATKKAFEALAVV